MIPRTTEPAPVPHPVKLLLIEDLQDDALMTVLQLEDEGFDLDWKRVDNHADLVAVLGWNPEAVLLDYNIPGLGAEAALKACLDHSPDIPVIVISGAIEAETGVRMMQLGAQDYLDKARLERLAPALRRGLERAAERKGARQLETLYQTLFEGLPVGVARRLSSGEAVHVNSALLKILAVPDVETYWANADMLAAESLSAQDLERIDNGLKAEHVVTGLELQIKRFDGSDRWIRMDISSDHDMAGEVSGLTTVITDIEDRKRAEEGRNEAIAKLRESNAVRQLLLERLITAQEEERRRIALDVHDDAVQVMAAANIRLVMLGKRLNDPTLSAQLDLLVQSVNLSTARLRSLIFELEPPSLQRDGVTSALRVHLDKLRSETGIATTLSGSLTDEPPMTRGILLYRMVQEALANVKKHSAAHAVAVTIRNDGADLVVVVTDDGVGFDEVHGNMPGHLGLASMRERAYMAGGICTITSSTVTGTRVEFRMPTHDRQDEQASLPDISR